MEERLLEEFLRSTLKIGKCILGTKSVISSIKGCKVVLYASSLEKDSLETLRQACTSNSVPSVLFSGTSERLGRLCGKPFKVSVIGVRALGEANLDMILSAGAAT